MCVRHGRPEGYVRQVFVVVAVVVGGLVVVLVEADLVGLLHCLPLDVVSEMENSVSEDAREVGEEWS